MTNRPGKREHIDELVCAALNMLDCQDLTEEQRATAEQIYELSNSLESSIEDHVDQEKQNATQKKTPRK